VGCPWPQKIRNEARRLGFFKVGIAHVRPLPWAGRFETWLRRGMHGDMGYMERQAAKRLDPTLMFASARSILVLAMNYHTGEIDGDNPSCGRISRYALGRDYHVLIEARLRRLLEYIRSEMPGVQGRCYVDTGPVMEKAWGALTTLGWMGKHTNLITRERGSWFFLGVILLDLELEGDVEERDFCGSCARCIAACPTRAIVAPYLLDARLCISYLTIELRGFIPRSLRPLVGNRIYGCDDCQEACPWNRFAERTTHSEFNPEEGNLMPELAPLVSMTASEFDERFNMSPIRRAKRDGFVRNVAVALGNSRREEAVPSLEKALVDSSAIVRGHAAWALGQVAKRSARRILETARSRETDPRVLEEIVLALGDRTSAG